MAGRRRVLIGAAVLSLCLFGLGDAATAQPGPHPGGGPGGPKPGGAGPQSPGPKAGPRRGPSEAKCRDIFRRMDVDKSGGVRRDEFDAFLKAGNKLGMPDQLKGGGEDMGSDARGGPGPDGGPGTAPGEAPLPIPLPAYAFLDSDQDDEVTVDEVIKNLGLYWESVMAFLEKDHDKSGDLTRSEYRNANRYDKDRDRKLSLEEWIEATRKNGKVPT